MPSDMQKGKNTDLNIFPLYFTGKSSVSLIWLVDKMLTESPQIFVDFGSEIGTFIQMDKCWETEFQVFFLPVGCGWTLN